MNAAQVWAFALPRLRPLDIFYHAQRLVPRVPQTFDGRLRQNPSAVVVRAQRGPKV
jgi:hypothetical protein